MGIPNNRIREGVIEIHESDIGTLEHLVKHGWVMSKQDWCREIISNLLRQLQVTGHWKESK